MKSFPVAWRWTLAALIAVVALAVAIWPRGARETPRAASETTRPPAAVSPGLRAAAQLADCPRPAPGAVGSGPLAGITVDCLATGGPVDLAAAVAGRPVLLNLWTYWCPPCAEELPALQRYAERPGAVTVLTVHSDPDEAKALARLTDLDVRLPGVQDGGAKVRSAVKAPAVQPISVLVRADGSVAKVVVRPFRDADDIAATVAAELGAAA
ncbi:TlpA family protein disulfide reductase [Nocardia sp. CDC159]|uniref:TlpA family protein disulfide reductase n=1 Tax=Nocardia pulmonis TaxID=2951408 RepID=A0A9X2E446_9NOCA|nr:MULTISPECIES: TlpA disulfide reductase family protein [Nocardia]MCM6772728.1 TlpA family protein disulfide reductase [Nocardia pulmonis]MCM6785969.1 TlpA family protein disulfide reductase [Nocardia sp. CDC159]